MIEFDIEKPCVHCEGVADFVEIDGGYKVTTPEGYVLHQDGDMVKLVNRIEFSKNNFTIEKNWKK